MEIQTVGLPGLGEESQTVRLGGEECSQTVRLGGEERSQTVRLGREECSQTVRLGRKVRLSGSGWKFRLLGCQGWGKKVRLSVQ